MLEQVSGFKSPNPSKEQYSTPATVSSELLHFAFMRGDLMGTVYDLGCGAGILAIGAKLLGAEKVIGFDEDSDAIKIARANAERLGMDVEFVCSGINEVHGKAQTVVMNPPFGAQVKGSDRPFLRKALELSGVIYSIHNAGSMEFIKKFISPAVITDYRMIDFPIKRTFKFHTKELQVIKAEIYRIEKIEKTEGLLLGSRERKPQAEESLEKAKESQELIKKKTRSSKRK